MSDSGGVVDYLCNAFTPDRRGVWEGAVARAGVPVKFRTGDDDGFVEPADMVARMDELGLATLLVPTCDVAAHSTDPFDFEHVAARWEELDKLASGFRGRFAALAVVDPTAGMRGVRELRARLDAPWEALSQLAELDLTDDTRAALTGGTARSVFTRLEGAA